MVISPQRIKDLQAMSKEELVTMIASYETELSMKNMHIDTVVQERNELMRNAIDNRINFPSTLKGVPNITPPRPRPEQPQQKQPTPQTF
jgi:hypothetical protein